MNKENLFIKISGKFVVYLYALILLIPMYFIIITALKASAEISTNPLGLPSTFNFSNFVEGFIRGNMAKYSLNSIFVAVTSVSLALLNAIIVSYSVYKLFNRKIGQIIYSMIITSMFIPGTGFVTLIALYQKLHLFNNYYGLILGGAVGGTAFNLFILLGFLRSLPKEIEEAAFIDGCRDMQLLFHIMIPLIKPALISIGIFAFVGNWNSLMTPLLLIRNKELYTIPLGLMEFRGTYTVEYNLMFAAILISSVPLVIIYLAFQKYFVEALAGGVKG